ncbi:AraC family transcriptional regulator [Alcanivorax nanhaiticus]|uniref:AraC family transcriptional regulator n=1 Tax=Alcanivorax nanhaiticus TaxID=1177154 RepID=A0A095SKQ0_9GAMM|nr:AraC family transcriptional regulator [Alcanivorax nanhaiticus]KGD65236.1 AraC family transcriptional regulator [Alcanivorax nanhaiticus]
MTSTIPELPKNLSASPQRQLAQIVHRWTSGNGMHHSAIEGVDLFRSDALTSCASTVYEPSLIFIIQGTKTVQLGDREIVYGPLSYLANSVHLPVLGQIVDACQDQPYLAAKVVVDTQEVTDLVLELGDKVGSYDPHTPCPEVGCGLCMSQMDDRMQNALFRLLSLLDSPDDIPILAPLARREIIYRALIGEMGPRMRKFVAADSQANRISQVISTLKDRYAEPLRVKELADEANMSESSLFHSFKQVTRMSPLQFQKKLRLHEARRLMLNEGLEAATASYRVGYESPSHFSREYSRMFGAPPKADVIKLRGEQLVVNN